jgi:predicted nucleic acid-binding protein
VDEQDEATLYLSVISLGEIEKGIQKLRASDGARSQKLTEWLGKVEQRFTGRVLALDAAVIHAWAKLAAEAELVGRQLPVIDGLIIATAQCHGLTVVTRNTADFRFYPQVFDPWEI